MAKKTIDVVSYNVNGIRAAMKKGLVDWLKQSKPDIVLLQEIKADKEQVDIQALEELGYHHYWFSAEKKGYSGTAILSKIKADKITKGFKNKTFDPEGRIIQMDIGDLTFVSMYVPSGSAGEHRQAKKFEFLEAIYPYLQKLKKKRKKVVVSGDYNICHQAIDLHNPKTNKNSSGFLPEERAWMEKLFNSGYTDSFRAFNKDPDNYSWWSYRAGARGKNKGWRLDYNVVSEELMPQVKKAAILSDAVHSDHCPVYIRIKN